MYTDMDKHTDQWLPWPVMDFNKIRAEYLKWWLEELFSTWVAENTETKTGLHNHISATLQHSIKWTTPLCNKHKHAILPCT